MKEAIKVLKHKRQANLDEIIRLSPSLEDRAIMSALLNIRINELREENLSINLCIIFLENEIKKDLKNENTNH